MTFGEFIREKRKVKGLSQRGFAAMIGVSPVYVSYFESGQRSAPRHEILIKISNALCLDKKEEQKMLLLAAQQKYSHSFPVEIASYIHENAYAKSTLRLAKECQITDDDWQFFTNYICNKYL